MALLKSTTVAMALAGRPSPLLVPLPPICSTLPGANITALLVAPTFTGAVALGGVLNLPNTVTAPWASFAAGSSFHIVSAEMPTTLPSGATQARGYDARR